MKGYLVAVTCLFAVVGSALAQGTIGLVVDGKSLWLGTTQPVKVGGRILVPLRAVAEGLGAAVEAAGTTVTVSRPGNVIVLRVNQTEATINGRPVPLEVPPVRRNGSVYVPLRFIGEAVGAKIEWANNPRRVEITTPALAPTPGPTIQPPEPIVERNVVAEKAGPVKAMRKVPSVVIIPWQLIECTDGGRMVAKETLQQLFTGNGYAVVDEATVRQACYDVFGYMDVDNPMRSAPTVSQMLEVARLCGADYAFAGRIVWRTRTIWTWRGPATKAYTKLDGLIADVNEGGVSFSAKGVEADSEERSDLRGIAGWLISPLAWISAGPKDPHHRRAAQLVIVKAFSPWLNATRAQVDRDVNTPW